MIYDVKLPGETKTYLRQVVGIQMDLLQTAAALQGPFTQQALCTALAAKTSKSRAERLAQWLFKHKTPKDALEVFVADDRYADKQHLVQSMRMDVVRLYRGRTAESLECLFPKETKKSKTDNANKTSNTTGDYWQGAKEFLISFYDSLEVGLPDLLFTRNPCHLQRYSRKEFFAAFERANGGQYVCAICDEHRHMTILRGKYLSDIEHYFPKSIYPHLACHPYNLIPICGQCNTAHLNKDPLAPAKKDNNRRRTLGEVFLPYRNGGAAEQGMIRLAWANDTNPTAVPILQMQARVGQDAASFEAKLEAFAEIYDIPGRWERRIDQIGEQLWRQMLHFVHIEMESGAQIELPQLKYELERLFEYLFEDQGRGPFTYVLVWYLANLLVEEIEAGLQKSSQSETVPILDTIRDALKERDNKRSSQNVRFKAALDAARQMYNYLAVPE